MGTGGEEEAMVFKYRSVVWPRPSPVESKSLDKLTMGMCFYSFEKSRFLVKKVPPWIDIKVQKEKDRL